MGQWVENRWARAPWSALTVVYLHWELQLVVQLRNQKIVAESLSHLHGSDDGSIDLVLPVLEYPLCGTDLFFNLCRKEQDIA